MPENARLPRNIQGSFTCRKSTTWDKRLYFPSEGRRAEDIFALKNPTASAGFEPANLGTKGQHATFRLPKPLTRRIKVNIEWLRLTSHSLLTYSIQQSPSWEANWFAASQRNSPHFMEPEVSVPHSQVPATCPLLSRLDPVHTSHIPLPEDPS